MDTTDPQLTDYERHFRNRLHQKLIKHLDLDELHRLCYLHLSISYEELAGATLPAKALALVQYVERRDRRAELIQACWEINPAGHWTEGGIIILNMDREITTRQKEQVEIIRQKPVLFVIPANVHFDDTQPFVPQIRSLIAELPVLAQMSAGDPEVIVSPPSFAPAATVFMAELHAQTGGFPLLLRRRNTGGGLFEVAEVIDLRGARADADLRRKG